MKAAPFAYHRVATADDALERLAELGDEAKLLAGGQSLVPMMAFRLVQPPALVDISRVRGLRYLRRDGDALCVGALTPHRELEVPQEPRLLEGFEVLRAAAGWIGHAPIRTRGTIGGSLCHADPAAEWCTLALLLDAELVARRPGGERVIRACDFFRGYFTSDLQPGELVVEVRFPHAAPHAALAEHARRHGDFALVMAAAALDLDERGECAGASVVVGGVEEVPVRLAESEACLSGTRIGPEAIDAAARAAAAAVSPPSDLHASATHRRRLTGLLVRQAIERALPSEPARGG